MLVEWVRSGQVDRVSDADVSAKEATLAGKIESDDEHILAVALLSGCRLLFSSDAALINDFKNAALVSPRGKVVKPSTPDRHAHPLFDRLGN